MKLKDFLTAVSMIEGDKVPLKIIKKILKDTNYLLEGQLYKIIRKTDEIEL